MAVTYNDPAYVWNDPNLTYDGNNSDPGDESYRNDHWAWVDQQVEE